MTKFKLEVEKEKCDDSFYHHQELLTFIVAFCCCLNIQEYSYFSACFDHFSSNQYIKLS